MKKSAKLLIAMVLVVLLVFTLLACGETDIQQSGNNVDYTISFETNGGSAVADIVVDGKTEITIPETSKEGYSFAGWFLDDKTFSIKVDLSYIKANPEKTSIKLYAKWIEDKVVEKTYKIVFSTNGGSDIADIVVDGKSEITMLNTTKSGYTFAGWYVDNNTFNIPFCLNYITANPNLKVIKIYAKWTTNRYTVTFDSNGGSVVAPITQEYNTLIVKPKNPTKTENNFVAWYKDSNLTVAFNFATDLLTKDTILYAKWTDQNLDQFFDFAYVDSANTSYSIKKKANINLPNEIVLPSSFNGKPVTAIEYGAFSGCSGLTS
ncbi:MAG: InlB B-repeat-containing protein, partial [Clostridia bacterium]